MSIEKKSLISNLKAAKKAVVATNSPASPSTSATRTNLRKQNRSTLTRSMRAKNPRIGRV